MKYGVLVGNTGHFDTEINLAGSGGLGHESRQLQASIDRFVFPLATVWSLLEAYKNEVDLLPKELDGKNGVIAHSSLGTELTVLSQEQPVCSVQRVFASFHLRLVFPNSSMRKWRRWTFRHSMWSSPSSRLQWKVSVGPAEVVGAETSIEVSTVAEMLVSKVALLGFIIVVNVGRGRQHQQGYPRVQKVPIAHMRSTYHPHLRIKWAPLAAYVLDVGSCTNHMLAPLAE